jgi:hypothetical protein
MGLGSGIRDPGVKKAPDPGSGSATLSLTDVFVGGSLECVGHSLAYVAHFVFLRYVWTQTQRAAVASRCATNLPE